MAVIGSKIFASLDGTNWIIKRSKSNYTDGTIENLTSVTFGNGLYAAVGCTLIPLPPYTPPYQYQHDRGIILTSSDGTTWTQQDSGTLNNFTSVTYGNGFFVAVCMGGKICTSPDGTIWPTINDVVANIIHLIPLIFGDG